MAKTKSLTITADVHYKMSYGVPEIEGIYFEGKDILPSLMPTEMVK